MLVSFIVANCLPKLCTGKYVQRQSHYNVQSSNYLLNKKSFSTKTPIKATQSFNAFLYMAV